MTNYQEDLLNIIQQEIEITDRQINVAKETIQMYEEERELLLDAINKLEDSLRGGVENDR